ncbi:hypothetical protein [Streptomyces yanii]|uniref:YCII-related domain-containing protein n=1 Tax=Streptomyces yanii TaxID=78510 RepID=A0ABV5RC81_9ACTN
MYLIHAHLKGPTGAVLTDQTAELIHAWALSQEQVEHVTAHPGAVPHPIVGVYVLADSLHQAEERVAAVCRRALRQEPSLSTWTLVRAEAPLLAPLVHGPLGPPENPSMGSDLRGK